MPADGALFDWRISVASIERPGPFSDFSGYARTMVLLAGGGVRLSSSGAPDLLLRKPGDLIRFDGARAVQCDLLDGACRDLNLMVAKRLGEVDARVEAASHRPELRVGSRKTMVLFCVSGAVSLAWGGAQLAQLEQWDTAVADADDGRIRVEPAASFAEARVFIAEMPGP